MDQTIAGVEHILAEAVEIAGDLDIKVRRMLQEAS